MDYDQLKTRLKSLGIEGRLLDEVMSSVEKYGEERYETGYDSASEHRYDAGYERGYEDGKEQYR